MDFNNIFTYLVYISLTKILVQTGQNPPKKYNYMIYCQILLDVFKLSRGTKCDFHDNSSTFSNPFKSDNNQANKE